MAPISRTLLIFGGFAAVVGAAFYPIYFRPLLQVEQYRKDQATNRSGVVQEDVQPPEFADTFEWPSKEGYRRNEPGNCYKSIDQTIQIDKKTLTRCDMQIISLMSMELFKLQGSISCSRGPTPGQAQ
ncbi:small integral membrane protein 20 isoform X4 [Gopherus evgoodei]|uniref:small integral membrane protein 20 isoform X4 n=1 Tax=Gopherus evgoodei TaxID=1825980 RepID=UPI0011D0235F|nr:small integral membrane protein 20 isoform X4 [Gopherus evgoodei]